MVQFSPTKFETFASRIPLWCWYMIWFSITLALYWPSIIILPKRDQILLMMGRHLVENDWRWFLDVLSYNRTRYLAPGDYFAFRPVHMAVLALGDIVARTNFVMQGVFSCLVMAGTATMFCQITRRFVGSLGAASLALLWVSQLAGVEIVLWQHINPYLLAPACMFGALLLITGDSWSFKQAFLAAAATLAACLTHELCIIIATAMTTLLLFDKRTPFRKRLLITFLPAVIIALLLNGIDYKFIHPPPALLGPSDHVTTSFSPENLIHKLTPLAGAVGSAFFRPDSVEIPLTDDFSFLWFFTGIASNNLLLNGIVICIIIGGISGILVWQTIKRGITDNTLIGIFFLLFFCAIFGVTSFRVLTRGIDYMFGAGYYFSLFALSLCGLLAYALSFFKTRILHACIFILFGLSLWHAMALHNTLTISSPYKRSFNSDIHAIRTYLEKNPSTCFGGVDYATIPRNLRGWSAVFQDLSCTNRPNANPLYLISTMNGLDLLDKKYNFQPTNINMLPLSTATNPNIAYKTVQLTSPVIQFGSPIDITIQSPVPFNIIIDPENEIPYNFRVHYNELLTDDDAYYNTLMWNATRTVNSIQIQFTEQEILFFNNKILLTALPRARTMTGKNCRVMIWPKTTGTLMTFTRFSTTPKPVFLTN